MKKMTVIALLGFSLSSFTHANIKKGEVLRSKKYKVQICKQVVKDLFSLRYKQKECEQAQFVFTEDALFQKFNSSQKKTTTVMKLQSVVDGVTLQSTLVAKLQVSETGVVSRAGFEVKNIVAVGFTDEKILKETWNGESIDPKQIKPAILKIMTEVAIEMLNEAEGYDGTLSDYSDFELGEPEEWEKVVNPESKKIIGYLVHGSAASEEGDTNAQFTFKFNTEGALVDYSHDSFGYHE